MNVTADIEFDIDDIADRVREDLDISDIAEEVIGSYSFENAVENAAITAVENALADQEDDRLTLASLIQRVATLEAALGAASVTLAEPARRVLHGVEVSATTTGLF